MEFKPKPLHRVKPPASVPVGTARDGGAVCLIFLYLQKPAEEDAKSLNPTIAAAADRARTLRETTGLARKSRIEPTALVAGRFILSDLWTKKFVTNRWSVGRWAYWRGVAHTLNYT